MRILITGPQGSGKTTQAELLSDKLRIAFSSAGDLARKRAEADDVIGRSVKEDLEAGRLIDDEVMAKILRDELEKPEYRTGFILDGYPREIAQLKAYDPKFDIVFYLDISDELAEKRLLQRGREDDTPEVIEQRLSIFHQLTEPVLDFYQKQNKLIRIDGSKSIEEVGDEIARSFTGKVVYGAV